MDESVRHGRKGDLAVIDSQKTLVDFTRRMAEGEGGEGVTALVGRIESAASDLSNTLLPVGKTLVQIINEPATLVVKMQSVHWGLYMSEGPPPASFVAVYEMLNEQFNQAIAAWNAAVETDATKLNELLS